jgi:hypothetical protein
MQTDASYMTTDQKRAFLLLKSVIFHYHGLDEGEQAILNETADKLQAHEELQWVTEFIASDEYTAFERAREYLNSLAENWDTTTKLYYLSVVWEANNKKGHITEMEATAMFKLAKDWRIQKELISLVRKK